MLYNFKVFFIDNFTFLYTFYFYQAFHSNIMEIAEEPTMYSLAVPNVFHIFSNQPYILNINIHLIVNNCF